MKNKWTNKDVAIASVIICTILGLPIKFINNELSFVSVIFQILSLALWVFIFWIYVRWVSSTAEKAGRSYLGFMFIAIFFSLFAWIIVLMFKKPNFEQDTIG